VAQVDRHRARCAGRYRPVAGRPADTRHLLSRRTPLCSRALRAFRATRRSV